MFIFKDTKQRNLISLIFYFRRLIIPTYTHIATQTNNETNTYLRKGKEKNSNSIIIPLEWKWNAVSIQMIAYPYLFEYKCVRNVIKKKIVFLYISYRHIYAWIMNILVHFILSKEHAFVLGIHMLKKMMWNGINVEFVYEHLI